MTEAFPSDERLIEIGTKVHSSLSYESLLCEYGFGWEDGYTYKSHVTYCHAGLRNPGYTRNEGPVVITNKVMYKYSKDITRKEIDRYTSFLMNDSVFSECIVNKDVKKVGKQGIIVRTDKPANLVAATCIASRQAWEHPDVAKTTLTLLDAGVPPRIAEITSYFAKVTDRGLVLSYLAGHSPFNLRGTYKGHIKAILEGRLHKRSEFNTDTYQENRSYCHIHSMWGCKNGFSDYFTPSFDSEVEKHSDPFGLLKRVEDVERKGYKEQVMELFEGII
jgi:hypothetical protein